MTQTQLLKKIFIKGEVEAITGLLIGGTNSAMQIGGTDKMVIRNPITNKPYIPGSSLKGKMRSLLEQSYGFIEDVNMGKVKNGVSQNINHVTTRLFGNAKGDDKQQPSRIIVRDGKLVNGDDFADKTELPYTETKTEVVIDRITSAAMPRTFERVPAGAKFKLDIVVNVFSTDKESELISHAIKGLLMVQDDYLGGCGSRGSGQVQFTITEISYRDSSEYQANTQGEAKKYSVDLPSSLIDNRKKA